VTRLQRAIELLFILVLFPIAALWVVGIAIAVSPTGFFAYLGALLAAWLLCTFVFPLAAGVMTTDAASREQVVWISPVVRPIQRRPEARATALSSAFSVVRVR
jgi:hypothetical protein